MASAPPQPELEEGQAPAPAEESVLDSVYNWLTDGAAPPAEGEAPGEEVSVVDSITNGLESVGATITTLIRGDAPPAGENAADGEAKQEPAEGQQGGVLDNFSKSAQETTEGVSKSISEWYYGPQGAEGEAAAPAVGPDGQPLPKQGFKHTVDESIESVKSWWGGTAAPEGEGAPANPGDGKPYLADWFLPAKKEGEEGEEAKPETVDVDTAVTNFFSSAASSLQRMVDKGPPPPDRTKAPASSSGSSGAAAPAGGAAPAARRQPPVVPRDTPKPAAAPPPRPVSSKAAVFGSTVNRAAPPPRPSSSAKPM